MTDLEETGQRAAEDPDRRRARWHRNQVAAEIE